MEIAAASPDTTGVPTKRAGRRRLESVKSIARVKKQSVRAEAPLRVLVVDDDPAIRLLCSIGLQLEGLVVLEAPDGHAGLAAARSERPDLVLADVRMPGLDGFQLADALRRDGRTSQIPLIFLSGEARETNESRARELGALAYVTKPFELSALASLVSDALTRPEARGWVTAIPGDGAAGESPPAA